MIIGIRREDKNPWERRSPLTPEDVGTLIEESDHAFRVQPSSEPPKRVFPDHAYANAGAEVTDDLSPCDLILGVKEIPRELFLENHMYMFFSHTVKAQPYNMPMLKTIMDKGCTLFDYELIADSENRRLVFFGKYAGLAGMIDTLAALGRRFEAEGIDSVFSEVKMAHEYDSLTEAKAALLEIGGKINAKGLDERITPLVIGMAGYGNVSIGAQEILDLLPIHEISPEELAILRSQDDLSNRHIYKVVFKEEHMVKPTEDLLDFELQDYYRNPENYESIFDFHTPHLNVLVNCIYWTERYPRLITNEFLQELYADGQPHLRVIGDISCDIEGSIEATVKATTSDAPCYVFDPASRIASDGYEGKGPVIMAVDNLPCEIPLEASQHFSASLRGFIAEMGKLDPASGDFVAKLPEPLKKAMIVRRGNLVAPFEFLKEYVH